MGIKFRHEIKYLIDFKDYYMLKSRLSAILKPDAYSGADNKYHIRSLYFDDIKNTDYFTKLSGFSERKKFRLRIYNDDFSFIKLEKKVKIENVSYKLASNLSYIQAQKLILGNYSIHEDSDEGVLNEFIIHNTLNILKPNVITDYYREAYIFEPANIRITFDSDLKTALLATDLFNVDVPMIPVMGANQMILEVKYDHYLPSFVSRLLSTSNITKLSLSKFTLCKKYIALNDWEVQ